jgi:hypothetical protein
MRAVRFLTFALLLVAGLSGKAQAQSDYNNTPGVYTDVKIGVVPAALPPGSLPPEVGNLGPDLYVGTLTVTQNGSGYSVQYQGERADGAKLLVNATFTSDWLGWKTGFLAVGSSMEEIIIGIDAIHLISATINGVGTVDGSNQRVIAKFTGTGSYPPDLTKFMVHKAPGNLR